MATTHKVEVNAGFLGIDSLENLVEGTQEIFTPQFMSSYIKCILY